MATETELERIVVKFVGDTSSFIKETDKAAESVKKFSKDSSGRIRDAQGKFVSGFKAMGAEMSMVEGKFAKLRVAATHFASAVGQAMSKAGKATSDFGKKMSLKVTAPLAAFGTASFKMATDFDDSMSKIQSLVGLSGKQVRAFATDVKRLSTETAQAPKDLADAMFFITSAGLRGQEAVEALEVSAKATAVGLGETAVVADLVTSAVNAYGSGNLSATSATDILTAAVREGKLEAADLSGAFGSILPLGSALGVEMHELGAAFAAMSRTGTNASEASTQIRSIFTSLLKPTKEAQDALAGMGLSAAGLRKKMAEDGLLATLELLNDKFDGNVEATAQVFGNVRALSGVLDLMGSNVESTRAVFASMENTTGALNKAFDVTSQTVGFKARQAFANFKVAMTDVGTAIMGAVTPMLESLNEKIRVVIEWWKKLSVEQQQSVIKWGAIVAAIGPVLVIIGTLVSSIGTIISAFSTLLPLLTAANIKLALFVGTMALAVTGGIALGVWLSGYNKNVREFNKQIEKSISLQSELTKRQRKQTENLVENAIESSNPAEKLQEELDRAKLELSGSQINLKRAEGQEEEFGSFARITGNKNLAAAQQAVKEAKENVSVYRDRVAAIEEAIERERKLEEQTRKTAQAAGLDSMADDAVSKIREGIANAEFADIAAKIALEEESLAQLKADIAASIGNATQEQIDAVANKIMAERREAESKAEQAARKAASAAEKIEKALEDKQKKEQQSRDLIGDDKYDQIKSDVTTSLQGKPQALIDSVFDSAISKAESQAKKEAGTQAKIFAMRRQAGLGGSLPSGFKKGSRKARLAATKARKAKELIAKSERRAEKARERVARMTPEARAAAMAAAETVYGGPVRRDEQPRTIARSPSGETSPKPKIGTEAKKPQVTLLENSKKQTEYLERIVELMEEAANNPSIDVQGAV